MQDIVFYVAANETVGTVRDYANSRNQIAPVLVLGVSACLRMRLFTIREGAAPYPIASFSSIIDWEWSMDDVLERNTSCKLKADIGGISVHTVTDTVNGETMSFSEFVIPISDMNTQEVAAWLGNRTMRSGLTGELDGYDENGNAVFVLQIENFAIRNRIAGLAEPTALDQGFVTRPAAEYMIGTAVSASAATKQDKLTSANAGAGISIGSGGTISAALTAGERMEIVSGDTIGQLRYFPIEPSIAAAANQTVNVVLSAGKAYEIHAVGNNAKVLLNRENPPSSRTFGLEGHAEIFVANTGYVQTGANVVLANALEPDSVNNCTVRFHDGMAIISVEDHVAGYIVTSATGTTAGSLAYGLSSAANEYISVDASLNGRTLDLAGATTYAGEKHVVGNGFTETILSGGITCTSKTTFSNLSMDGVVVSGGVMTFGDVNIPDGSTVSVSGGGLAIERVTGDGGTIDLGGTSLQAVRKGAVMSGVRMINGSSSDRGGVAFVSYSFVSATDCWFENNHAGNAGVFFLTGSGNHDFTRCTFLGNRGVSSAGNVMVGTNNTAAFSSCLISGNQAGGGAGLFIVNGTANCTDTVISGNTNASGVAQDVWNSGGVLNATDCNLGAVFVAVGGLLSLAGSNTIDSVGHISSKIGSVTISSGASVNLASSIDPGGGITLYGGAFDSATTIIGSAGGNTQTRTFEDLEVHGTSISSIGAIYGATVYSNEGDDHELFYTTDGGATSSSVIVTGATEYVVEGGLLKITNT